MEESRRIDRVEIQHKVGRLVLEESLRKAEIELDELRRAANELKERTEGFKQVAIDICRTANVSTLKETSDVQSCLVPDDTESAFAGSEHSRGYSSRRFGNAFRFAEACLLVAEGAATQFKSLSNQVLSAQRIVYSLRIQVDLRRRQEEGLRIKRNLLIKRRLAEKEISENLELAERMQYGG